MRMPWLSIAALLGALAIVMGAAGAHLLENATSLRFFDTAFTYHMFHVFPLIAVSFLTVGSRKETFFRNVAGVFFLCGILLFSGSLYYLGLTGEAVGLFITPMGGLSFIAGWLSLAICGFLKR